MVLSTAEYAEQLRTQVMAFLLMTPVLLGLLFFLAALPLSKWLTKPVRQAWDAQKQFIADASHELKTPLTVILANLSILRRQYPDEKWLESTHEEAQRMRRLVEEMLTLARTENERHALTLSQTNLSELLEHTLMTMEPVAFERGVTLQTHIAQNVTVPCSELHARRLMMILLDNAVKYAEGEKKVTVTLTGKQDPCELRVSNTGAPIPPEILPHVFDRFYRGDTTRAGGGFGLGLAIAKETVEALRGSIGVTSSESDGTTFTVLLRGKGGR